MKTNFLIFCLLSCIVFNSCNDNGRTIRTIQGNKVYITDLDSFIQNQIDSLKISGLSIAIIRNNKIVYQGGFGVKNLITKEKVTYKTLFEICSLSKPVFAYFVMLQVEKGILDLDTPLYKYLPYKDIENDARHKLITARMVLTHTSGLPNWREQTNGELKILFEPGTAFGYSGEGYQYLKDVLNHLLKVDDKGLNDIFQKEVVKPLGLEFMHFTWENSFASLKAYGHRDGTPTDNGAQLLGDRDDTFGAGYSLHATSTDYAKFLIYLMNPDAKHKVMIEKMLQPQNNLPNEKGELHRSIAFPIKKVGNYFRYYHSGNNGDFRAYFHFYKEKDFGIVMLSNSDSFFSSNCAQNIVEFLDDIWFYV